MYSAEGKQQYLYSISELTLKSAMRQSTLTLSGIHHFIQAHPNAKSKRHNPPKTIQNRFWTLKSDGPHGKKTKYKTLLKIAQNLKQNTTTAQNQTKPPQTQTPGEHTSNFEPKRRPHSNRSKAAQTTPASKAKEKTLLKTAQN